jgi:hypothetical protein
MYACVHVLVDRLNATEVGENANSVLATGEMPFFSHKPGQSSTSDSGHGNDPRSDLSLSQVQRRPHSKTPSPQRMPSLPTVMEERSEDASSMSRRSFSTQSTVADDGDGTDVAEAVRSYQLSRGQAAPSLPTIDSGEPLTWDTTRPPTDDPFTTPTRPRAYLPNHDYERPHPLLVSIPRGPCPPAQIPHTLASLAPFFKTPYTHPISLKPGIRLLSGNSPVDHFKYDAEGYATGALPRSLYRSPRSRSPTPAVDDEDYRISADGSVHYTGQSRMTSHVYDNTRSIRQPQYTEVGEGEMTTMTTTSTKTMTKIPRKAEMRIPRMVGRKMTTTSTRRRTTSRRNRTTYPNQRSGSTTLTCLPTQHRLTQSSHPTDHSALRSCSDGAHTSETQEEARSSDEWKPHNRPPCSP